MITHNYALELLRMGVSFTLLLPRKAAPPVPRLRPFSLHILPGLPLAFNGPQAFLKAPLLFSRVRYNPPSRSIVHSVVDFPYAALAYRYAHAHRIPFYMNAIGTYSTAPFSRFPDRFLFMPAYRAADRIIAISLHTKASMMAAAGHDRPIDVLYLPVRRPVSEGHEDFSIYDRLPAGKRYVLTITSLRAYNRKGFDDMLAAFNIVRAEMPDMHLVAIGGLAFASEACTVFPQVTAAELAALYSRSSVFAAMPFRTGDNFEGYGLVYREAGLYGKPVIGTYSGGVSEAIENNVTGFLVPEHGVMEMASALRRILSDTLLAERFGVAGHAQAVARTWEGYVMELLCGMRHFS